MKIAKKYERLFRKSKPLFIVVVILSVIVLAIFGLWIACKVKVKPEQTFKNTVNTLPTTSGTVKYIKGDETKLPELYKEDANGNKIDDFKIAVVGDLHLGDGKSDLPIKLLENMIKIDKPDLVVVNGDICVWDAKTTNMHQQLNQMFERNNQYWTFALGNHDGQAWESDMSFDEARVKQFNALAGIEPTYPLGSRHCIAATRTNDIHKCGVGNNCIKITGKNNIALKYLFTFDCDKLNKYNDGKLAAWYTNTVNTLASNANNYVLTHIPFLQMEYAWNHRNDDPEVNYISGVKAEPICADAYEESGLFNAIKSLNKTDACIFSHDHVNNFGIEYQGVRMQYSLGMSWNSYSSRNSKYSILSVLGYMLDSSICNFYDGWTDLYINHNQTAIGHNYAQFNGALNGLEFDLWKTLYGLVTYGNWLTIMNRIIYPLVTAGCITYFVFFIIYHKQNKSKKAKK